MHRYRFEFRLFASTTIEAESEDVARDALWAALDDAGTFNLGAWSNGEPILADGAIEVGDHGPDIELIAIDGEDPDARIDDEPVIVGTFEPSPAQREELAALAIVPDLRLPSRDFVCAIFASNGCVLDARELGTVLAALRHWQDATAGGGLVNDGLANIATDGGTIRCLGPLEIDALCERLNCDGAE